MSGISNVQIQEVLEDLRESAKNVEFIQRKFLFEEQGCYVFLGVRRAGKSYLMYQRMHELVAAGISWDDIIYVNFEDERLIGFDVSDFNKILECHSSQNGSKPVLFLDEVQNVPGWHKFARRLADSKYVVYITGSNANMLSSEISTTLGGRYFVREVFPYSFKEFLEANDFNLPRRLTTQARGQVRSFFKDYFCNGGFPESLMYKDKRSYISSVFQKIYLGDIVARNGISNVAQLRMLIKKLAESVKQPISYNRISNVIASSGLKIGVNTVISLVDACCASWLLMPLKNYVGKFGEKESKPKYYFIDNGLLNLLLVDPATTLLENLVAVSLFRNFGHDRDNEKVFFYNAGVEVDFYVPDEELAVQACYSVAKTDDTMEREIAGLSKLPKVLPCKRRVVVTYDEEGTRQDAYGQIEIVPCWKWLLNEV